MAKTDFDTPMIFGALCDRGPAVPRGMEKMIRVKIPEAILLPFHVEERHLKNVVRCMQLMDVMGLIVMGRHRRQMTRHLRSLDASAKIVKMVDVIIRKGRGFRGYSAEHLARLKWAKEGNKTGAKNRHPSIRVIDGLTRQISVELLTGAALSK